MNQEEIHQAYPWITMELFQRIVEKAFPKNVVHVEKYLIKTALGKGENFTSQMLRAIVTYTILNDDGNDKSREIRFIIKAPVTDCNIRKMIEDGGIFQREIINFELILPEVYKLLTEIGDDTKISAKYIHSLINLI